MIVLTDVDGLMSMFVMLVMMIVPVIMSGNMHGLWKHVEEDRSTKVESKPAEHQKAKIIPQVS